MSKGNSRLDREKSHFDIAVAEESDLDDSPAAILASSDLLAMAVDSLGTVSGKRILDVACGTGRSSVVLAAAGADVVGCDVSAIAIEMAQARAVRLGLERNCRFEAAAVEELDAGSFDGLFGCYALHHLDLGVALPALGAMLRPGGSYAFLETSAANPLLMLARRTLRGRFGIARYGSEDEHPLTRGDLRAVTAALGPGHLLFPGFAFFQIGGLYLGRSYAWKMRLRNAGARVDSAIDRWIPVRRWTYWVVVRSAS